MLPRKIRSICSLNFLIFGLILILLMLLKDRNQSHNLKEKVLRKAKPTPFNYRKARETLANPCNTKLWNNCKEFIINCTTGKPLKLRYTFPGKKVKKKGNKLRKPIKAQNEDPSKRLRSFSQIFKKKTWLFEETPAPNSGKIYGSGRGSGLNNTKDVVQLLHAVVSQIKLVLGKKKIKMLDIPCGDMFWMPEFLKERDDVDYYGMDIVPDIIKHHEEFFKANKSMHFIRQDIVSDTLDQSFDLIFTRKMTQHLTNKDTLRVFKNFDKSGSIFLLGTTTHDWMEENFEVDIVGDSHRFRPQDLFAEPYGLPDPLCWTRDEYLPPVDGVPQEEVLALWKLPIVPFWVQTNPKIHT